MRTSVPPDFPAAVWWPAHRSPAGSRRAAAGWQAIALLVVPALCACEPGKAGKTSAPDVLARVNGTEVTLRQLAQRAADAGLSADLERTRLLDAMIDEQLLVQRAIDQGLDRDGTTQAAIDRARRQLLARAAIERLSGGSSVGNGEAKEFYRAHPELFGARKVYTFRRFVVHEGTIGPDVRAKLDGARNAAEVSAILTAARMRHTHWTELRTAESLPEEILARAGRMSPGDLLMFRQGIGTILIQLAGSYPEPIRFQRALPGIKAHLAKLKRERAAQDALKDLRRSARIEYSTQASIASGRTTLAAGQPESSEPPPQKLLQPGQPTLVR